MVSRQDIITTLAVTRTKFVRDYRPIRKRKAKYRLRSKLMDAILTAFLRFLWRCLLALIFLLFAPLRGRLVSSCGLRALGSRLGFFPP